MQTCECSFASVHICKLARYMMMILGWHRITHHVGTQLLHCCCCCCLKFWLSGFIAIYNTLVLVRRRSTSIADQIKCRWGSTAAAVYNTTEQKLTDSDQTICSTAYCCCCWKVWQQCYGGGSSSSCCQHLCCGEIGCVGAQAEADVRCCGSSSRAAAAAVHGST